MEIYTSYFYKVRFFKPNYLGFSTALSDPKWFHDFQKAPYTFIDKNGVINGLRATPFVPGGLCVNLCAGPQFCAALPQTCAFLQAYYTQLTLLDRDRILEKLQEIGQKVQQELHFVDEPKYILLVHEAPSNLCSERIPLQRWLQENNLGGKELTFS